jgi:hypothetical protein
MPDKKTLARARADKRQGKAVSTQAGEFVKEEIDHIREGVHGARSAKQAIAIGLSKARRAGVEVPPSPGKASAQTRLRAHRDSAKGRDRGTPASARRSRASLGALQKESTNSASTRALARHARASARARTAAAKSAASKRASRTKGAALRSAAATKAARARSRHSEVHAR